MDHTLKSNSTDRQPKFIPFGEVESYYSRKFGVQCSQDDLNALSQQYLLPRLDATDEKYVFTKDLEDLLTAVEFLGNSENLDVDTESSFWGLLTTLQIGESTFLEIGPKPSHNRHVFFAAARNLIEATGSGISTPTERKEPISYYINHQVSTENANIRSLVKDQLDRYDTVSAKQASQFAETAQYMGSKKRMRAFLIEAISNVANKDTIILDLMCGSGAASSAFCEFWPTYASDAQEFSRILAKVQGSGYDLNQADQLLDGLLSTAREHAEELEVYVGDLLDQEDELFHSELNEELYEPYIDFVDSYHTYYSDRELPEFEFQKEIQDRKENPATTPYMLFTTYFANTYFGLRQSVEIDSLRYAIDQLNDVKDRLWSLGALITTCSVTGTTFAGHFAQPKKVTENNITDIIEQRANSIFHEFSIRLQNLAEESQNAQFAVNSINGPWETAIRSFKEEIRGNDVVVYLDAPYKRDEYGRYYHVLETLVRYHYPTCTGEGKTPSKEEGDRFSSEFHTRDDEIMTEIFGEIISCILKSDWICAWSYSDNAACSIPKVVDEVHSVVDFEVKSFCTPSTHASQGSPHKDVTEYLILFQPS